MPTTLFSENEVDDATPDIALPDTASGDLLCIDFVTDQTPTVTWPAGYSQMLTPAAGAYDKDAGSVLRVEHVYRICDGTEPASIALTLGTANQWEACVTHLTAAEWHGTMPPEIETSDQAGATTTTPDPPSLTPSWGSENNWWCEGWGNDHGSRTFSGTYSSGYSNGQYAASVGSGGCALGLARKQATAASDNPAANSALSLAEEAVAWTWAVRPAAAGSTPKAGSDTGSGAEISAETVQLPRTETGAGTDTVVETAQLPGADAGTGGDSSGETATLPASDTGLSTETSAQSAVLAGSDMGSGADSAVLNIQGEIVVDDDTGSAVDVAAVTSAFLAAAEVGIGSDGATVTVSLDTGEIVGPLTDTAGLSVAVTVPDGGAGADLSTMGAGLGAQEQGSSQEEPSVSAALAGVDTAVAIDAAAVLSGVVVVHNPAGSAERSGPSGTVARAGPRGALTREGGHGDV